MLSLDEYQTEAFDGVSPESARAFDASGLVRASRALDGRLLLTAASKVGVIRVGDPGAELHVRPKMPISRLLWMVCFARDGRGWLDDPIDLDQADELVPAMAAVFAHVTMRALRFGVLQGYEQREESLPLLRGRLRESDQMSRRFGLCVPLEVRFDDYQADIAENRMLLSAARRLLRLPGVTPATRRVLLRLCSALPEVSELTAGAPLPVTRANRLNARYQPALALARLVLTGASVEQPPGSVRASGFVFDMNDVFEDWLTAALRLAVEARRGGSVRGQHRLHLDHDERIELLPDITWWTGGKCQAVVDAKYKHLKGSTPPNADIYQMLAYCSAFGLAEGHLVYGSAGSATQSFHLVGGGTRVTMHGLDLSVPIDDLRGQIERLAELITTSSSW